MARSIPSLDGIRAVAIFIVFFAHLGFGQFIPGGFGVTVFFFLSGFLITTLFTREVEKTGSIDLLSFFKRRLFRLSPPLLITLGLVYFLLWLGMVPGDVDAPTLAAQILYYYNYYGLFVSETVSVKGLGVLWSLSVEEHFYLIYPLVFAYLLVPFRKSGAFIMVGIIVMLTCWRCFRFFYLESPAWDIFVSTDTRIDSIMYGSLLALLNWQGMSKRIFPSTNFSMYVALGVSTSLLAFSFLYRDDSFRSTARYSLQGLALIPIFFYAVTRPQELVFKVLNNKLVKLVGLYSYSIYLVHFVTIYGLINAGISSENHLVLGLATGAICMVYAALMHEFIEKPSSNLCKRLTFDRFRQTKPG